MKPKIKNLNVTKNKAEKDLNRSYQFSRKTLLRMRTGGGALQDDHRVIVPDNPPSAGSTPVPVVGGGYK